MTGRGRITFYRTVIDGEMFLKIYAGTESVLLPMSEALRMRYVLENVVPYQHRGGPANKLPHTFIGESKGPANKLSHTFIGEIR